MLAVEMPLVRASTTDADVDDGTGSVAADDDEVYARLQRAKSRVPDVQSQVGAARWKRLCETPLPPLLQRRVPPRVASRAFHKLHEIVLSCALPPPARSAHLCEAPGGFVQCVAELVGRHADGWRWTAFSLPDGPAFQNALLPVDRGVAHAADVRDADACVALAPDMEGACDLVTADGAVAMDHGDLEAEHAPLLEAEARLALRFLAPGGTFVCKAFECLTPRTLRIVAVLTTVFDRASVIKPTTSRATNSERYLVLVGFRPPPAPLAWTARPCQAWEREARQLFGALASHQADALARVLAAATA